MEEHSLYYVGLEESTKEHLEAFLCAATGHGEKNYRVACGFMLRGIFLVFP
jgi:hypothetical protein